MVEVRFGGHIITSYWKFDRFANGSVGKILWWHLDGLPLSEAIVKQAGKYPPTLRQYWADIFWLSSLRRIKNGNLPKVRKKSQKSRKRKFTTDIRRKKLK